MLGLSSLATGQAGREITQARLNILRPLGGYDCADPAIYCVGKDASAEYTVIGGAALQGGTTNAAGSAMAAVTGQTQTARAVVVVGPGRWNEAVVIDKSWVTLHILPGTIIRPVVTAGGDVNDGVVRVAPVNSGIEFEIVGVAIIVDGIVQNDAYSPPEPAIEIGSSSSSFDASGWNAVTISGSGKVIGHHDGVQLFGSKAGRVPTLWLDNLHVISGRDAIAKKHNARIMERNVLAEVISNYCEDPNAALTAAIGPHSVDAGAGGTTSFRLAAGNVFFGTNKISGRRVTFAGGAGCPANGQKALIRTFDTSTRIAAYTPSTGTTNDADCTYTILAVGGNPVAQSSICSDDWTPISASVNDGQWKMTARHLGNIGATTPTKGDLWETWGSSARIEVNDFSPLAGSGCVAAAPGIISGFAMNNSTLAWDRVRLHRYDVLIEMNTDVESICSYPIAGIHSGAILNRFSVDGDFSVINTAEPDDNIAPVLAHYSLDPNLVLHISRAVVTTDMMAGYSGTVSAIYDYGSVPGTVVTGDIITGDPSISIATYGAPYPSSLVSMVKAQSLGTVDVTISSDTDALDLPTSEMVRLTASSSAKVIGGIAKGYDGRYVCTVTVGANTVTFENEESTATAQDRIVTHTGADVIQGLNESSCFYYDQTTARWRMVSFTGNPA